MQDDQEASCGQELAASAEIPDTFGRLLRHVAVNLRAHARAVGQASPEASLEHAALLRVASGYEEIADAAARTAKFMLTLATLPPVLHDGEALSSDDFVDWMATKIALQRKLGGTLLEHAEQSESALAKLRAAKGG